MTGNDGTLADVAMYCSNEELNGSVLFNPSEQRRMDFTQDFAENLQKLSSEDEELKKLVNQVTRHAFIAQDPNSIPDELREELMRQKRKEEAYKTALCDSWRRTESCAYRENCRFAHGVHELRMPSHPRGRNHPKYKTVLCDKFSMTGTCKYGVRCQFIHKIVNPALYDQATGLATPGMTSMLNQSLFDSSSPSTTQQNMNQTLPIRISDINRAFARAADSNQSVARMTKACENQFRMAWMPRF